MTTDRSRAIHDLDATLRVGKKGIESVTDELSDQLDARQFVKVKFLRAARGTSETADLAADLAERVGAEVVDVRGHTAVFER